MSFKKKVLSLHSNIWAVLISVPSNPWRTLNWFRATDGLSGHEFTVGAAPLAVLSRFLQPPVQIKLSRSGRNGGSSLVTVNSPDKAACGA